jgi:hypoxanthine-DNA glycosylase
MTELHSFNPIIDNRATVLILGSMPGEVSLQKQEYYAHPQNCFWVLIYTLFGTPTDINYEAKISFLKSRRIALWDVIQSCQRSGSLDSKIINPVINDFADLLSNHPAISTIFFNGKKAEQLFKKNLSNLVLAGIQLITLPSSSPANAGISLAQKQEAWNAIKEIVNA